jgi:molybdopterin converting factor small subunit
LFCERERKSEMTVNVKFVGSFRGVSGKDVIALRFKGSVSLRALVSRVVERLPRLKSALVDPASGEPRTNMLVLVNGREIGVLDGLETAVNDGDEVVFVPVMHGG